MSASVQTDQLDFTGPFEVLSGMTDTAIDVVGATRWVEFLQRVRYHCIHG
jgi:hypothetical protein